MSEEQIKLILIKAQAFEAVEQALLETNDPAIGGINALMIVAQTRITISNIVKEIEEW